MRKAKANLKIYLALPERLRDLIEQSLAFMRTHPEHMLNFGYRYAIYAAIGSEYPSRPKVDVIGHQRRTYLNILTAEYGLPAWDISLAKNPLWKPLTRLPQDLIEAAKDILFEGITTATYKWIEQKRSPHLSRKLDSRKVEITNDEDRWRYMFSIHVFDNFHTDDLEDIYALTGVGGSVIKALRVALWDDDYTYEQRDFLITEAITDLYGWDSAYYMMCVFSFWLSDHSDKHKRKAFWEWWLLDAIPQAYNRF